MLAVHRAAVRGTAAKAYDPGIIVAWAPLPLRPAQIEGLAQQLAAGVEHAIVARDARGRILGFGSIVPDACELRAAYVAPEHGRSGLGSRLLATLESLARKLGLPELHLDASLNAEAFYRRHGYAGEGRSDHVFEFGQRMPYIRMHKTLGG